MSTSTTEKPTTRYLGGEAGHRSFFGGSSGSRARGIVVGIVVAGGLILTPLVGWPALAGMLVAAMVTIVVTTNTHHGSILERRRKRSRWQARKRLGTDRFEPYDATRWAALDERATTAPRKERAQAIRDRAAMRAMPDGADGMGWLQSGTGLPGIAWHAPDGEDAYLSVCFAVAGQIRGIESNTTLVMGGAAWGRFLADRALSTSLVGAVQPMTRVLPPDTARHEAWARAVHDPTMPADAIASYAEVIRRSGQDAMIQRHYVVVSWPITPQFTEAARKYGEGRDGWRALMAREVETVAAGLRNARLGGGRRDGVTALTARQTVALMLHQQNPSHPIDAARRVDPAAPGLRSHDEYAAHVVEATDYVTGQEAEWWHRTVAITADGLSTGGRTQLWLLDLLLGTQLDCIRSVSFHMRLVPAMHAKAAARRDLTADQAAALSNAEKGKMANDEVSTSARAASQRVQDLSHGSPHHGIEWAGFITLTARSRSELQLACRRLAETCSASLGVERLTWLDSFQAAASGTTWPIGRGLRPTRDPMSARFYNSLAGAGDKEAL
ncbi:hypothetical protein [Cellulosimicrobium sp. NPDC057862]|uniref:hypothetical protein n=1 Tax=Actinomycetes TaxID=1760 RepID=UPI00366B41E8